MTHRSQQTLVDYLYLLAEAIPWFMLIALFATLAERDLLTQIAERIATELPPEPNTVRVLAEVRAASTTTISGPPLPMVMLTGLIAFTAMRTSHRLRLGGAGAAATLLVISIVGLNMLLHYTLTRDLLFWQTGGAAEFINQPEAYFPLGLDLPQFVLDPDLGHPHGAAAVLTFFGLVGVWVRFMVAGRHAVSFERAARSFTFGFVATLVLVVLTSMGDASRIAGYAVPYFVIAVLMLAVAHSARPQTGIEDARRAAPWLISVIGTIGALTLAAVILGLLALIDAGSALQFLVDGLFRFIGWVMVLVLTPVFWVLERLLDLFHLSGRGLPTTGQPLATPTLGDPENPDEAKRVASSLVFLLKLAALSAITYGLFAGLRLMLNRRREAGEDAYDESRSVEAPAVGLGRLLRNLVPRLGGGGPRSAWMSRHDVYRLFGRVMHDADVRGLGLLPGETPLEFASVGASMLDAPMFPAIAAAFDRARYGRHFPERETLMPLARALTEWETSHPATEELRERMRGARQPTNAEQIETQIVLRRRAQRGDPDARSLLDRWT